MYTLGTASKATGKTKPTILNAIKKGRLSAQKNDLGHWQIEPSELHRAYPLTVSNAKSNVKSLHGETPVELIELRVKVKALEDQTRDLKEERDDWKKQAHTLLLSQKPVGLFARLFGR